MTVKRVILLVSVLTLGLLAASAAAWAKGGSGVVTPLKVGSLSIGKASDAQVIAFAGHPDTRIYCRGSGCSGAKYKTYEYRFSGRGLTTYTFAVVGGRWTLEGFYTNQKAFRTAAGTRVGTSSTTARQQEHLRWRGGCLASGLRRTVKSGAKTFTSVVGVTSGNGNVKSLVVIGPQDEPCL